MFHRLEVLPVDGGVDEAFADQELQGASGREEIRDTGETTRPPDATATNATATAAVPEVGGADEAQLRLQPSETDAVAGGGVHPDDVQHLGGGGGGEITERARSRDGSPTTDDHEGSTVTQR